MACGAYVLGQERSQGSEHASTTISTDTDAVNGGMARHVNGESTAVCCVSGADHRSDCGGFEIVLVADETGLKRCAGRKLRADLRC